MSSHRFLSSEHQTVLGAFLEIVQPSLGTAECTKCLVDKGEEESAVFIRDTSLLVRSLHVSHPVGQVAVQVCTAHRELYGCGVKSLLFCMGHLGKRAEQLRSQGIPLHYLEDLIHEAVEDCVGQLEAITVPVTVEHRPSQVSASPEVLASSHDAPKHPLQLCNPSSALSSVSPSMTAAKTTLTPSLLSLSAVGCKSRVSCAGQKGSGRSDINKKLEELLLAPARKATSSAQLHRRGMLSSRHFNPQNVDVDTQSDHHVVHAVAGVSSGGGGGSVHPSPQVPSQPKAQSEKDSACSVAASSARSCESCTSVDKKPGERDGAAVQTVENVAPNTLARTPNASLHRDGVSSSSAATIPSVAHFQEHNTHNVRRIISPLGCPKEIAQQDPGRCTRPLVFPEGSQFLSHGSDEAMTWAGKVMSHQLLRGKPSSFDLNLVHTCSMDGGSSYEVVSGLVLRVDQQALETVVRSQDSPFKALLVSADLTPEAKHKGFKQTLNATKVVSGCDAIFSGEQSWVSDVMALFEDLKVSVVLVKGKADSALKDLCGARGVAVLEMVPHHALVVLWTACNVDLTTYVLESTPRNVCDGLMLKPLLQDWTDRLVGDKNYLVITFPAAHVQTLVIRHPSPGWREVFEQEFWLCAGRLSQALKDKKVLPGGGRTESWCGRYLLSSSGSTASAERCTQEADLALYRPVVRAAVAEAFTAFASTVRTNRLKTAESGSEGEYHAGGKCPSETNSKHCDTKRMLGEHAQNIRASNRGHRTGFHDQNISASNCATSPVSGMGLSVSRLKSASEFEETVFSAAGELQAASPSERLDPVVDQYDNYTSKVSGWRSAVSCVCMIMKMDTMITTGIDKHTAPVDSVLL